MREQRIDFPALVRFPMTQPPHFLPQSMGPFFLIAFTCKAVSAAVQGEGDCCNSIVAVCGDLKM
jgi:hypothetical protein